MLRVPKAGVLLDPGLGKSACVLQTCYELREHGMFDSAVVISTLRGAHEVWGLGQDNERDKWNYPFSAVMMHGPRKLATLESDADLRVINWDGLDWLAQNWQNVKHKPDVLVIDESTKGKNHNARRSKALKYLCQFFKRIYILTGTPTPKSMMDLWGQVYYLDNGRALGKYPTQFRNKYFRPGKKMRNPHKEAMLARGVPRHKVPDFITTEWELKEGAEEEIYEAVKHLLIRFSDKELGLKEPIVNNLWVDLDANAMDRYLAVEEEDIGLDDEGRVIVANAGARTMRQRQVANGGLYLPGTVRERGPRMAEEIHLQKAEMIADLSEELYRKPLLVGFEFHHDRDRLLKVLGKDTPVVDGGTSIKDGSAIFADFNNGDTPILLAQIAAVAHAVNLQHACSHVAFHSMTYNLEDYIQFLKRVLRSGQKNQVTIFRLLARNTVDEDMANIIDVKDTNQRSILARIEKASRARLRRMRVVRGKRVLVA